LIKPGLLLVRDLDDIPIFPQTKLKHIKRQIAQERKELHADLKVAIHERRCYSKAWLRKMRKNIGTTREDDWKRR
jgi:hypothetical protein